MAVLAVALLVGVLRTTPPTYHGGDLALVELYTLHASRGDLALGAYSRWGWNHPGPAYFYLLAPLYALTGHEFSLHWTALLLNLACVAAAVILVGRYGGWPYGLGLVVAFAVYFFRPSAGPFVGFADLLSSVWNPHTPILPFALLLVLCARLATGGSAALPWIVLVASVVVQAHVGFLPSAAAVIAVAAVVYALHGPRESAIYPAAAASAVFVVLWCLPLLEQLRGGADGNLARMLGFLTAAGAEARTTTAFAAFSYATWAAVDPGATFPSGGPFPPPTDIESTATVWTVLQVGLLAGAGAWASFARRAFPAALCLVGLAATGAAFWSVARVPGVIHAYLVFWISIIGVVNTGAVLGLAIDRAASRWVRAGSFSRAAAAALGLLLTVHGVADLWENHRRTLGGDGFQQPARDRSRELHAAVADHLRGADGGRALVCIEGRWPEAAGVVLALRKAGIPLAVEDRYLWMFGPSLRVRGEEDTEVLFTDAGAAAPPYRLLARQGVTAVYSRPVGRDATQHLCQE